MRHSKLLVAIFIVPIVVVAGYLGAAAVVYENASHVEAHCGGRFSENTPATWRPPSSADPDFDPTPFFVPDYYDVRFPSRDTAIELHAWWLPSSDGADAPAVVVIHGLRSCIRDREALLPAAMLSQLGYSVLMLDLRDHGESSIEDGRHAGGTEEYRDVMAAVDWLVARGVEPGHIGALGTSMGAATAIIAAGQDDRIAAIWADTSYADIETRVAEELDALGLPRLLAPAATLVARVVSGDDYSSHTILGELATLGERDLFITHGELDQTTFVSHGYALIEAARAAAVDVDTWIVGGADHVEAMFLEPAEYQRRLGAFFGSALGRTTPLD